MGAALAPLLQAVQGYSLPHWPGEPLLLRASSPRPTLPAAGAGTPLGSGSLAAGQAEAHGPGPPTPKCTVEVQSIERPSCSPGLNRNQEEAVCGESPPAVFHPEAASKVSRVHLLLSPLKAVVPAPSLERI